MMNEKHWGKKAVESTIPSSASHAAQAHAPLSSSKQHPSESDSGLHRLGCLADRRRDDQDLQIESDITDALFIE